MKQKEQVHTYIVDEPEIGDLRWKEHKLDVWKKKRFGGVDLQETKTTKDLQRFDGKEWKNIPSSYEFTSIDL